MSNIIEEIKLYVKHGKLPIVQDNDKEYAIVTVNVRNKFKILG